jgi:gamma-glutamyl:cysteine ligase YbdK (ATP-grasp superfamily)
MTGIEDFKSRFNFSTEKAFFLGVEREYFITTPDGVIVPKAFDVLEHIHMHGWRGKSASLFDSVRTDPKELVGFELSACQIETRTKPCRLSELKGYLSWQQKELQDSVKACGYRLNSKEVAPDTMPLDVFPDPSGRYATVTADMPKAVLLAACQVIGTHIHVGMPDHETALRVYNGVLPHVHSLCKLGDHTNGKRLRIYRVVAPDCDPKPMASWGEYFALGTEKGFVEDPRSCWTLVRISIHGTIEFRMFGGTHSVEEVMVWAKKCHKLCTDIAM